MEQTQKIEFRKVRDFGELLNATFEFIRLHFKNLGVSLLKIVGPAIFITGIISGMYNKAVLSGIVGDSSFGLWFILNIFATVFTFTLLVAVINKYIVMIQEIPDEQVTTEALWAATRKLLPMYFLTLIGATIAVAVAAVLFIIPGIYLVVVLSLIYFVRTREDHDFFGAISRCRFLIRDKWWATLGLILVLALIQGFLGFVFQIPQFIMYFVLSISYYHEDPSFFQEIVIIITSIISSIGNLFYAISVVGIAFHYYNLVERKEASGLMEKIETIS